MRQLIGFKGQDTSLNLFNEYISLYFEMKSMFSGKVLTYKLHKVTNPLVKMSGTYATYMITCQQFDADDFKKYVCRTKLCYLDDIQLISRVATLNDVKCEFMNFD